MQDGDADEQGDRVLRRVVLATLGGALITGMSATVAAALDGGRGPAGRMAAPVRHARLTGRQQGGSRAVRGGRGRPRAGERPARPMYYLHDGPMTVALTIDDGPGPVYTPQILRVLAQHGVTATFSMVGQNVARYPYVARDVAAAGHAIANHTWSHANLAVLPAAAVGDQIARAAGAIHAATGQRPALFRAPYGAWSPVLLDYCAAQGLTPLDWSVDPRDWARPGVAAIAADILRTTRSGAIILEHDGGGDRSQTVAALKIVLPRLLAEGFRFGQP
jgi:peptidoglycan/xylan/chitin deacetylase (PgdA/CDA1 family)